MLRNNFPLFFISLIVALFLTLVPLPVWAIWWRPSFVVLVTLYWLFTAPQQFGLGTAFVIGIILDTLNGTLVGEHALAMVVTAFVMILISRTMRFLKLWQCAVCIAALVFLNQLILFIIEGIRHDIQFQWLFWVTPISSLIVWPLIYTVMNRMKIKRSFSLR